MFCTNCGNELPKEAKFCHSCGRQAHKEQIHKEEIIQNADATEQITSSLGTSENKPIRRQAWKIFLVAIIALVLSALLNSTTGPLVDEDLFWEPVNLLPFVFWVGLIFAIVQFFRERKLPANLPTKENEKGWSISKWESDGKKWITRPVLKIKNTEMVFYEPREYIKKLKKLNDQNHQDDLIKIIDELQELQKEWDKER